MQDERSWAIGGRYEMSGMKKAENLKVRGSREGQQKDI